MVISALEGKKVELTMIAANRRTHPVYAKDTSAASCAVHLAKSPRSYIYNIADGTHPIMQDIAEAVREVIPGADIRLGTVGDEVETRPVIMDRMKDEFGFIPRTLKEGIKAYIAFIKNGDY
jgi:nucleoside-diphosphate-sugar epimerase